MSLSAQPLWTLTGIVEAPVDQVADVLLHFRPGPVAEENGLVLRTEGPALGGAIVLTGGPRRFTATFEKPPGTSVDVEVDRAHRRLVVQGHFWYRGVYTIEPHTEGARIVYRVYSIAGLPSWFVRWWQFPFRRQMPDRLRGMLRVAGRRLDCGFRLCGDA